MKLITHEIYCNVESSSVTISPPIDIHEGDSNSHVLLFKLRNGDDKPIQISESSSPVIKFYDSDTNRLIVSNSVSIVNAYRGVLSYTIGPAIVSTAGRKTVYLDLNNCQCNCSCGSSVSFTMTVSKVHDYCQCGDDVETTITKAEHDKIMGHIADKEIHLDGTDREFLSTLEPHLSELSDLVSKDFDKEIEDKVKELTGQVMKQAFITVDYLKPNPADPSATSLYGLSSSEICDGKIVRVNYPNHDGDPSTSEDHDGCEDASYFVAKKIGDKGDIEWHPWEFDINKIYQMINDLKNQMVTEDKLNWIYIH